MTQSIERPVVNRREFLKQGGSLAAGAAVLGSLSPVVFARGDSTIRLA
ncbi:MAG: twin-arginine translocation signal domain-containing protein, partial [Planctomycetota bacterium]